MYSLRIQNILNDHIKGLDVAVSAFFCFIVGLTSSFCSVCYVICNKEGLFCRYEDYSLCGFGTHSGWSQPYRFNGKESNEFAGLPYFDYCERFYRQLASC